MRLDNLTLYRLKIPLGVPYKLAFGPVHAFDTILVQARDGDGRSGLGEATLLTGYTDETVDGSWRLACELAGNIAGQHPVQAQAALAAHFDAAPFTATALMSAIEMLQDNAWLRITRRTEVPVLGLLNATEPAAIEDEITRLFEQGYATLKVKVGFNADADSERVRVVQRALRDRGSIRLDANQGYSREDGCRFAASLDPHAIELFEQPCAAGDWEAAQAVARVSRVPMMLDESIYRIADIDRAADLQAARFIKVKLMKLGGLDRLAQALAHIRARGMEPVLGNGVACEIGCWMEACVARTLITNAGEMNGFLKPVQRLLTQPLQFERGAIVLQPDYRPALDRDAVARFTEARESYSG